MMFAAFLTTILFSLSAISANRAVKRIGSIQANFGRTLIATFFLAIWAHSYGHGLSGKALPVFLLSGLIGFGLGDVAFLKALPKLGSRLSMMLVHCLATPIAALVEWLWLSGDITLKPLFQIHQSQEQKDLPQIFLF